MFSHSELSTEISRKQEGLFVGDVARKVLKKTGENTVVTFASFRRSIGDESRFFNFISMNIFNIVYKCPSMAFMYAYYL